MRALVIRFRLFSEGVLLLITSVVPLFFPKCLRWYRYRPILLVASYLKRALSRRVREFFRRYFVVLFALTCQSDKFRWLLQLFLLYFQYFYDCQQCSRNIYSLFPVLLPVIQVL